MKTQLEQLLNKKPSGFINEVNRRLEEKRTTQVEAAKQTIYKSGIKKTK
jgi:hypothetical protein